MSAALPLAAPPEAQPITEAIGEFRRVLRFLRQSRGGRTRGKQLTRAEARGWQMAEGAIAEHIGVLWMRRAGVDAAKAEGISREGLKEHGGWLDTQVPDSIYADQEAEAPREEARAIRAKIRGEKPETPSV